MWAIPFLLQQLLEPVSITPAQQFASSSVDIANCTISVLHAQKKTMVAVSYFSGSYTCP